MQSFALVALLAALFATGTHADIYKRQHPRQMNSSDVIFSFTDAPTSALPSGTGVPQPAPSGGPGSGASIYVCHPVDPSAVPPPYPGTPNNLTSTPISSGPAPTGAPPVSASVSGTGVPPVPTGGQGSRAPIYVCYPADPSSVAGTPNDGTSTPIPSSPVPTSDVPPVSSPASGTGVPQPVPTDGQGSVAPNYLCYPINPAAVSAPYPGTPNNATLTPTPSGPLPTSTPPASAY